MARYKVSLVVEAARIDGLRKRLTELFPSDNPSVEKIELNRSRADRLSDATDLLSQAKDIVQGLQEEMQEWYDNMPENLQGSSKGEEVNEAAEALQSALDDMENITLDDVNFPAMM